MSKNIELKKKALQPFDLFFSTSYRKKLDFHSLQQHKKSLRLSHVEIQQHKKEGNILGNVGLAQVGCLKKQASIKTKVTDAEENGT